VKKTFLVLLLFTTTFLLSSCSYKTNRFSRDLEYERDIAFIEELYDDLLKKAGHTRDLMVPYDHMGIRLTIDNTKYVIGALYYGVVFDENEDEYFFRSHLCLEDDDKLRCYTDNNRNNKRSEVEESIEIGRFLDTVTEHEIYELINIVTDEYDVLVTDIDEAYISVRYYDDTVLDLLEEENVYSILLDGNQVDSSGQYDVNGFYLQHIFFSHAHNDTDFYIILNMID
jgi:hypothetical protein